MRGNKPIMMGVLKSNKDGLNRWETTVYVRPDGSYRFHAGKRVVVANKPATGEKLVQLTLEQLEHGQAGD